MSAALASPSALSHFIRHEMRLTWRDWSWLFSGRRNRSTNRALTGIAVFALILHLIAYIVLSPFFARGAVFDLTSLAVITVSILLSFTMLLSQSLESVTRAFYARDDLDLLLSSPASSRDLFLVRIGMMALASWLMSVLLIAPFINIATLLGGAAWLAGYAVTFAVALLATGAAIMLTLLMFRTIGAQRTRLIAQIVAAVIGAAFLIGLQMVAIVAYGSMSRFTLFNADFLSAHAPEMSSVFWWPAHAASGAAGPLSLLLITALGCFAICAYTGAVQFREIVISALGVSEETRKEKRARRPFKMRTTSGALIYKEIKLIGRDPWLISQTLMQVLYLLPPALMMWVTFGEDTEVAVIIAPVVVMAVGQLAGGLAWLTISGEDAPDLMATAPVAPRARLTAKVKAVLVIIAGVLAPLTGGLALASHTGAAITFFGAMTAATCAILIQLWFRSQAKRTLFRRRQVASKAATFSEAFASILCAGTTAMLAAGLYVAVIPAMLLVISMGITYRIASGASGKDAHAFA